MKKIISISIFMAFIITTGILPLTERTASASLSGKKLYNSTCKSCHGKRGKGNYGPNIRGKSYKQIKNAIKNVTQMQAFSSLPVKYLKAIARYLR